MHWTEWHSVTEKSAQMSPNCSPPQGIPWGAAEGSLWILTENLLHGLISNQQHPRQPGNIITTFQMTQQSPQMFKWLLRKWPLFSKYLSSWKTTTRGNKPSGAMHPMAAGGLTAYLTLTLALQEAAGGRGWGGVRWGGYLLPFYPRSSWSLGRGSHLS